MPDHIIVDGESVPLNRGPHLVLDILEASGLSSPHRYDLIRLDLDGHSVITHRVGDVTSLATGDEFITARISTATA